MTWLVELKSDLPADLTQTIRHRLGNGPYNVVSSWLHEDDLHPRLDGRLVLKVRGSHGSGSTWAHYFQDIVIEQWEDGF